MKKKANKKVAVVALSAAAILVLGSSLAYFTDRASTSGSGKAGTVAITLDDSDLVNTVSTLAANENGSMKIIDPGDGFDISTGVTNSGNKSIRLRETVELTATDYNGDPIALTDENGQAQYEIYRTGDVEYVTGRGYQPKSFSDSAAAAAALGANNYVTVSDDSRKQYKVYLDAAEGSKPATVYIAKPIAIRDVTNAATGKIVYKLGFDGDQQIILDGNHALDPHESGDYAVSNIYVTGDETNHDNIQNDWILLARGTTANNFQASNLSMNLLYEACQARNVGAWEVVGQETYQFNGNDVQAVPEETVITDNGVAVTPPVTPPVTPGP